MGQKQVIALPSEAIRLDSLSNRIACETGFVLSFNAGKINPGRKISFSNTKIKLDALLSYLHKRYQITHKTIGNHIILYYDNSTGKGMRVVTKNQKNHSYREKTDISNKRKTPGTLLEKETMSPDLTNLPDIGTGISLKVTPSILPKKLRKPLIKQNFFSQTNSAKSIPNKIHLSKGNNHFYVSAGLTASEVLYANPQIKAGLPWLFALGTWGTNFKASGFFYGLGTSVNLSDSWGFQLSVSSGELSKSFRFPLSSSDTMMRIKTRLTRINFLAEKQISNRWTLQFGPVFNFTKSNYSLKDSSIVNSLPPNTNLSKDHSILHPPYTISNSYNENTASGKKFWIGFQIGLFYTLW